jgi:uncharacterized protein YqeY
MGATHPAAGATFAFFELGAGARNVFGAGFGFFHDCDPANPLVLSEGCEGFPLGVSFFVGLESFFEIGRQVVRFAHMGILALHSLYMNLLEKLQADMKDAMKGKDLRTLETLRLAITSVKNKAMEVSGELSDADVLQVIISDLKKLKDGLATFVESAREDLATQAREEIAVLERYLPEQLTDGELIEAIKAKAAELGVTAKAQAGRVIGVINKEFAGRVDTARVKAKIDELFAE